MIQIIKNIILLLNHLGIIVVQNLKQKLVKMIRILLQVKELTWEFLAACLVVMAQLCLFHIFLFEFSNIFLAKN